MSNNTARRYGSTLAVAVVGQRRKSPTYLHGPHLQILQPPDRAGAQDRDRIGKVLALGQRASALPADGQHLGQVTASGQSHQLTHGEKRSSLASWHIGPCDIACCYLTTQVASPDSCNMTTCYLTT